MQGYRWNGFAFPFRALTDGEAAERLADLKEMENRIGTPLTSADLMWRGGAHYYAGWVNDLVRHPGVLDVVEDVIGPDILVFWSTFFIKEPKSAGFTAWHQDSTYFGLAPYEHVTAWLALSEASEEAGCMEVLSSRGQPRQMRHDAARLTNSLNGAGQVITEPLDDNGRTVMSLRAGEFSLHHTLCCHTSAPNRASHRRVGLGISYIPTRVKPIGSLRLQAMLVRGEDRYGHFDLLPGAAEPFDPAGLDTHERAYGRFRENYREQEERHRAAFGTAGPVPAA
ncbi:phytanoyl-CoA dioxygenase family protein [Belnapia sp. T6]|uniref:Phytanoyl-CoA dioxygenase family protein n=1 Tax=Belnapia mucosa TaxID=2804532 RepID=A0ABS1VBW4_9PROT|nr:phytanoyl-CoA dioxygenase family protein [Belnapia mucosa]MBL6458812.1 phytanoyl-CoA dioxygenase family protein [Belnapia mucosa]